jgi:hypothetical protein
MKKNCPNPFLLKAKSPIVLVILFMTSCITQKNLEYLQDPNKDVKAFDESEYLDYKLKPNDELLIQVSSLDDKAAGIFSNISLLKNDAGLYNSMISGRCRLSAEPNRKKLAAEMGGLLQSLVG